jgi:uncharacterized protein YdeI (YjbR/CyaY-like superfamily)
MPLLYFPSNPHMTQAKVSHGVVHTVPKDLQKILMSKSVIYKVWEDITPLARNEWICWIMSAKKDETRKRRLTILQGKFIAGERRPCCWAGCQHR